MKITLNYDPMTSQVTDNDGSLIATWAGLETHEAKNDDVETLVKLKNAGFETDDIIELRRKELI